MYLVEPEAMSPAALPVTGFGKPGPAPNAFGDLSLWLTAGTGTIRRRMKGLKEGNLALSPVLWRVRTERILEEGYLLAKGDFAQRKTPLHACNATEVSP